MKIKRIDKQNYKNVYNKFSKIKAFKVQEKILFYELKEFKYWINNPKENLLYGVFDGEECVAFCFCKIISNHWALIDNFYVCEEYRFKNLGSLLQVYIEKKLKSKNISYVSRVTREDNFGIHKFLLKHNYKMHKKYIWFDKFI